MTILTLKARPILSKKTFRASLARQSAGRVILFSIIEISFVYNEGGRDELLGLGTRCTGGMREGHA